MKFGNPEVLWLLLIVPLLALLYYWAQRQRVRALGLFGDPSLLARQSTYSAVRRVIRSILILSALTFLIVGLARPRFGTRLEEVHRKGLDLVVALDVSKSMLTEDVKPNRLDVARSAVAALLDRLLGDRIGLVVFAGTAFVQCPLTLDYAAARMFLDMVSPELIPVPGTDIKKCIKTALTAFNGPATKFRVVILITDGEHHGEPLDDEIKEAQSKGVRIYTIGIGNTDGGPIPLHDENGAVSGYKKDSHGSVVVSRLGVATLEKIAAATQGRFRQATRVGQEIEQILGEINQLEKRQLNSRRVEQLEDRFQWFVGLGFILLLLALGISERASEGKEWYGRFV